MTTAATLAPPLGAWLAFDGRVLHRGEANVETRRLETRWGKRSAHLASRDKSMIWLVLWKCLEHDFYILLFFQKLGNVIIPIDELIFGRGLETTTSNCEDCEL